MTLDQIQAELNRLDALPPSDDYVVMGYRIIEVAKLQMYILQHYEVE